MEYHNRWCASGRGRAAPVMTDFGRRAIRRMNELGIAVDTAHASDESALAMVDASTRPVGDSHTASRDRVPLSRGLRDATLQRIARSGGVIGVHFAAQFLSTQAWRIKYSQLPAEPRQWQFNQWVLAQTRDPDERIRLRNDAEAEQSFYRDHNLPADPELTELRARHVARVVDLANLVDYLVALVGIDHVGFGPDVNGIDEEAWPADMLHIGRLPRLTAELLRRGYDETQLGKLLSDNWRRSFGQCLA
jgi:membrane dipeptidase